MLGIANFYDSSASGKTIVETHSGEYFQCEDWPTDGEPKVIAYVPNKGRCELVDADDLADDIRLAVALLKKSGVLRPADGDWLKRLQLYAAE